MQRRLKVALDIVPMMAGRGGTGSGIWTYAANLLRQLDALCPADMDIVVFARRGQLAAAGLHLTRLKCVEVGWACTGVLSRLLWVHGVLPLLCRRHRVDVLHKLATETPAWCPARRVTTLHDFYYEFLLAHTPRAHIRLYERLEHAYFALATRVCFRRSRALLAVSDAVRAEAVQRHPEAAARVIVVPLGAPSIPASPPASPATPAAPALFVCVAKFMTHKGQLAAVRAVECLAESFPHLASRVRLRFRGFANDRAYAAALRAAIARSPLAPQIEWVDYQAAAGVPEIYGGAAAALLLSQYEGFGLPVLEAQSQGVPVICSDLPVLHEVAGPAALFVDPAEPAAVARAMVQVVEDAACRERLRVGGLANVTRFTWPETARQTLAVYRQVAAPDRVS